MLKNLPFSFFDIFIVIVLIFGILRGRKRGISEEFLDVLQWIAIVIGAGLGYRLFVNLLITDAKFPPLLANITAYLLCTGVVVLLFGTIRRAVGEKLVQGDVFGRFEFYFGMIAGMVRFGCIVLFCLALLHAKYSTAEDRAAFAKLQQDNFGSISLPTPDELQYSVFYKSASGNFIRTAFSALLIQPLPPASGVNENSIARRRERAVDEVLKTK